MEKYSSDIPRYLKVGSLFPYFISFVLPVFKGDESIGLLAFFVGLVTFPLPWLGNIFYIIAVCVNPKYKSEKLLLACLAIGCACYTFSIHELKDVGKDHETTPVVVGLGFFFWFGSFIIFALGVLLDKYMGSKKTTAKTPPPFK